MKRFKLITVTIVIIFKIAFVTSTVPQCNQLLTFIDTQFINNANNYESWFGNIRLPVNTGIKTPLITISLIFDHPVDSILSNYGTVLKLNSTLFRLVKRNSITNERNLSFEFFVRYNGTYPNLAKILINNVAQCDDIHHTLSITKRSMNFSSRRPKYVPDCSNEKFVRLNEAVDDKNQLMATVNFYGLHLRNESIVNIAFDKKVMILGITKQTTSQTLDGHHFEILMPPQMVQKSPLELKFFVKYNELEMLPKITEVNINGMPLCFSPTLNALKIERQPRAKKVLQCLSSNVVQNYKPDDKLQRINAEIHVNRNQIDENSRSLVAVTLDRKVHHFGTAEYPTRTLDGKNFIVTINNIKKNIEAPQVLHVTISFDGNEPKPKIIEIRINEFVLCGPEDFKNFATTENVINNNEFHSTSFPNALQPNTFFNRLVVAAMPKKAASNLNNNCKFYGSLLVAHNKKGDTAERNQFPWHVAIYYGTINDYIYTCGGSLISNKAILTAAHCVTHKGTVTPLANENFIVYFGLHSLRTEMGGEQYRKLSNIIVHPEYNVGDTYYSDIAIIKFDNVVEVTPTVQPICLWTPQKSNDISQLYNRFGLIPGWGLNHGAMNENLTFTTMMVMPKSHCIKKKPEFYNKLLTGKAYCVSGYDKKSSVCNGDSGGGMVIPYDSSLRLRGIVSVSIKEKSATRCNSDIYPVFTDVAQFLPWIEQNIV